ncbi:class I SAM-dependent methyltransferase [Pseudochrobactrum sp. Wa41.01b-1]|uniref:class I SAM-dependent methyltransferase n=1 Tax=Pseudochrobactrum sp. Wa41.01b-1 TaxID=2864102 RepID=UPI001C68A79D|nr:class I SAM-dependent methyltransferase [Pseudochrobactrum sp. Wa41.01b-1]QYM73359.1 class I SAM-dependent methyltransferase [Pseudochrobactrum sp. Wa41.01b-1]
MAQNIYDNTEFFAGYSQLPRQVYGLDGAPEWPLIQTMLPDLTNKNIIDLGCGFGWASRWMRANGAASVLGLDISENMINRARELTSDPEIEYNITDLETVSLPVNAYDFAYSALALHYLRDLDRLARMVHSALKPNSDFVFIVEHPIYMAASNPQWLLDHDGRKTWPVNGYSIEGQRQTDWFAKGVIKYHRTLASMINILIKSGFNIARIEEYAPTQEQLENMPYLAEELERPMMLLVSAHKA